ncbi:DNA-binding response OmpR family regulator [Pseudomonas psychrotolerans]|uniref:DNA-binding response OmpR family regulator n=1 Tax=Pseudomonas oryzihabitans TaxID=47885 RepID=A0AAJ2BLF2_9PSED|nr:DNA-binding response OmpR family regulator [Pseudomonas psychrotolerans]MDR6353419.1 DNA-binding response OmpR family regulator [Pseudomonas psychrotolerans]
MSGLGLNAREDAELFGRPRRLGYLTAKRFAGAPFRVAVRSVLPPCGSVAQELADLDFLILERQREDDDAQVLEEIGRLRPLSKRTILLLVVHGGHRNARLNYLKAGADVVVQAGQRCETEIALILDRLHGNARGLDSPLLLDTLHLRLVSKSEAVELSYSEMTVLRALSRDAAHVLSYDQLAATFGMNSQYYDRSALSKSVSRLRTRILSVFRVNLIESIRGYGYRLNRGLLDVK